MMVNDLVFQKVKKAKAQILVVTKYYEKEDTEKLIDICEQKYSSVIFGYGENRVKSLKKKVECRMSNVEPELEKGTLKRENCHFIGTLQSKKLKTIVRYCSVLHSLDSLKHARLLNECLEQRKIEGKESRLQVFLQIKLDSQKPTGIDPHELGEFYEQMRSFKHLSIIGISGMGKKLDTDSDLSKRHKRAEFQQLIDLRDQYLPGKLISAGTSQDYDIALSMGIDVVRVGRAVFIA